MDTTVGIGDNSGGLSVAEQIAENLKDKHPAIVKRAADLAAALERLPASVDNLDDAEKLSETVRMCTAFLKNSDATRVEEKEPYQTGGRAVDGFFKNLEAGVEKTKAQAGRVRSQYDIAVEARERARRVEEARIAQEAADKAAEEARKANTAAAQERVLQTQQHAEETQQATKAPSADLTRSRTGSGVTTSLRSEWRHEVTLAKKVPRKYCEPVDGLLKAAVKAATQKDGTNSLVDADGNSLIPGVRIYEHKFSQVR